MFRAGLLHIIRRVNSVSTATGIVIRYVDPSDEEQEACSKHVHVEAYC